MSDAFFWGLLATSSLLIGGCIASRLNLGRKTLGIIMAFGAGTLISFVTYELIFEEIILTRGTGFPGFLIFTGALTFFICDRLIERANTRKQLKVNASETWFSFIQAFAGGVILIMLTNVNP